MILMTTMAKKKSLDGIVITRNVKPSMKQIGGSGSETVLRLGARHDPMLLFRGKWPHSFFAPRDIACHKAYGQSILVIEKYAVHQLSFNENGSTVRPVMETCLMEDPEFLAQGLRSISIECGVNGTCHASIFSASGLGGLRCPLSEDQAHQGGQRFHIHGDMWRSITSSNDGGAWALRDNTIVKLARHSLRDHELIPQYEALQNEPIAAIEHLHAIGNRKLLGLNPSGWFRSWPLSGNEASHAIKLSPKLRTKWIGMCSIGSSLYFGGVNKFGRGATVWQMRPKDFARTSVLV